MTALDRLIPNPRRLEIDRMDLDGAPERVWPLVRHGSLPHPPVIRALFAARTLVSRARTEDRAPAAVRLDTMTSSPARPGFQILVDDPPREVAVGAIGKVWRLRGATDAELDEARGFQRNGQFLPDFIEAENSMGFHAGQEAARILARSIDFTRQGQIAVRDAAQPGR